jgi:hypothetical protein
VLLDAQVAAGGPGRVHVAHRLTNWGVVAGGVGEPGTTRPRPPTHRSLWSRPARREELVPHIARFTSDVVDIAALVAAQLGSSFERRSFVRCRDEHPHERRPGPGPAGHPAASGAL